MPVLSGVFDFNGSVGPVEGLGPLPTVKVSFFEDDEKGLMMQFEVLRNGYTYTMQYSDGTLSESKLIVPLTVVSDEGGGGGGGGGGDDPID